MVHLSLDSCYRVTDSSLSKLPALTPNLISLSLLRMDGISSPGLEDTIGGLSNIQHLYLTSCLNIKDYTIRNIILSRNSNNNNKNNNNESSSINNNNINNRKLAKEFSPLISLSIPAISDETVEVMVSSTGGLELLSQIEHFFVHQSFVDKNFLSLESLGRLAYHCFWR